MPLRRPALLAALGAFVLLATTGTAGAAAPAGPVFGPAVKLAGAAAGTEPRVAVGPGTLHALVTNDVETGDAIVFTSPDGQAWTRTAAEPANQQLATIDTDVVTTRTGRIIASELDFEGVNFRTSYSDDGGATWTASSGATLADTDRQWLAVGPDDPTTHQPRVYQLFHNLASGTVQHNMFVQTSTDGGATFGTPVPVTSPPGQAYQDLQCADSGGPSNIVVNQHSGQVYVVFGTRSSQIGGGCGASATGTFEVNVVAATRVWVATAPASGTADATAWSQSLAVDDNSTGQIVGMQLAPGAVDDAGNVYVVYPESVHAYPDYTSAAIKVVHAPADLSAFSAPVTVAPAGQPGNILPHIVAGDAGRIDVAWFHAEARQGTTPVWYATAAQSLDALDPDATFTTVRLSDVPTYTGTASTLMGACSSGPVSGATNGLDCSRATDVWGVALDSAGRFTVTWPTVQNDATGSDPGTFVTTQVSGPTLLAEPSQDVPETPWAALLPVAAVGVLLLARQRRLAEHR